MLTQLMYNTCYVGQAWDPEPQSWAGTPTSMPDVMRKNFIQFYTPIYSDVDKSVVYMH